MFQNGSRNTQITLRIFEVNRVDLMRHSARTNFSGFDLLLEVLHRDILPEVTVHIHHNGIDTLHCIKNSRKVIIVRNLRCILFTLQPQLLCNKSVTELFPIVLGICNMMCIVISGSATELGSNRAGFQCCQLTFQTVNEHHHFFTQAGGRSRLTVSFGKHRDICPVRCVCFQLCNQFFNQRIVDLFQCFFDRKGNRRIVDILRSQSEVDEFLIVIHPAHLVKFFFQEVFYCFHVVVSHTLDIFNALCIRF